MTYDVVIAGAGPNGLMLACELSLGGVRPLVLEALPERSVEPKANGLVGQVVRMLDRRGLYERLSGQAGPSQPAPRYMFGAMPLDLSVLADNSLHILGAPQRRVLAVLEERALELGVEVRYGHELTGFTQHEDRVELDVAGPDGPYRIDAGYLVGADGGKSATRKLSGIGFPGVTTDSSVSRSAYATVPADWVDPVTGALHVPGHGEIPVRQHYRTGHGVFTYAKFPDRPALVSTMEWGDPEPDEPMTLDELAASVRRVLGAEVPLGPPEGEGPHLLRRLAGVNTRLAEKFRDGRVFLVGDAAHVHSAIGGPGLNLGLQDAINLGWKLAAAVTGWASPDLLDSYEAERRPVAERVVMHSQAQSALIAPGSEVTALRELLTEMLEDPKNVQRVADLMSGADIRYDLGGEHPLTGSWAPDLEVGAHRLAELTRDAKPLLVDLTEDGSFAAEAAGWGDRVTVAAAPGAGPATALLLRPDCYVAWASSSETPDASELGALRNAAAHWFDVREPART
ncbi:FAD-dependent monooxygenase [Amycolatopsis minnesotensis]|uniref:FAD-dependent monooxygenase n=1 Tax=Amycolatopsis minnesotensis TaxID=337894 RepID=A0ABN2RXP0_9PSEU